MPPPPIRFSRLRWLHNLVCVIALVLACALVALGVIGYVTVGIWMAAAGGFALFIVIMMMTVMPLLLKMESTLARHLSELRDLRETVAAYSAKLDSIAENTRISDAAKSLAHRDQEIDTLRNAIHEEIRYERWEAAFNLVDEIERRFAYKVEAAALRSELEEARGRAIQAKLGEAIKLIADHFEAHDWDRAQGEIERLLHALPDDERVLNLIEQMKTLKEQHKQDLKGAWDEAVRRSDVDAAIDVLKWLDQYLSREEAEELQSSARHVFKEKLLQLGVQFRFAVTEKRWRDALTTGMELVREFPNSRMATEVREALDTLRERARQATEGAPAETLP